MVALNEASRKADPLLSRTRDGGARLVLVGDMMQVRSGGVATPATPATLPAVPSRPASLSAPVLVRFAVPPAFLEGSGGRPNADAAKMTATFWVETVQLKNGTTFQQLQYMQRILLNFNGLSWPHISVATLRASFQRTA